MGNKSYKKTKEDLEGNATEFDILETVEVEKTRSVTLEHLLQKKKDCIERRDSVVFDLNRKIEKIDEDLAGIDLVKDDVIPSKKDK